MIALLWIFAAVIGTFLVTVFFGAPYVPTHRRDLVKAFDDLQPVGPDDLVVDIGSGDGTICREASRRGARAVGYDINPILILVARYLSRGDSRVRYRWADVWRVRLPQETTIVYIFGTTRDVKRLSRWMQRQANELGRPIPVVSYAFEVPGWTQVRRNKSHILYEVKPLQAEAPSV